MLRKENEQIVAALNGASGILTATGTLATGLDVLATAIGASVALTGVMPRGLVMNPTNLATFQTQKAGGTGQYVIDPLSPEPLVIHGVSVYPTGAVAAGTGYIVSPGFGEF